MHGSMLSIVHYPRQIGALEILLHYWMFLGSYNISIVLELYGTPVLKGVFLRLIG